jgi:GAF domain-containing protein
MISRLPAVAKSADNAAATAFRTAQLQLVRARPGELNGAIVAPVLSSTGCVGVISAEIRGGGETSESVQALAAIFAAQLAGVLKTTPAADEVRAATGTDDL